MKRTSLQARYAFARALDNYRTALRTGTTGDIVMASVRIHSAKGLVPKSYHRAVNAVFRAVAAEKAGLPA